MKTERNILIAFILNLVFSFLEFFGGMFTGSVAIISDAVHDIGDAASIGISYFLEKKSKKLPDEQYTYGYSRYSVIGGVITTFILLFGSAAVIINAIRKIINPSEINYDDMIIFAIFGVIINLIAAYVTHGGDSINQKTVSLHMLEDVLGWAVVLIGAIVMRFTDFAVIDPIMSIGVALFIIINSAKNLKEVLDIFLEKIPQGISVEDIKETIGNIKGIIDIHHIHIRSIDGHNISATMHIVTDADCHKIKEEVREKLEDFGILHATLELETSDEHCHDKNCDLKKDDDGGHRHGHHHHHH